MLGGFDVVMGVMVIDIEDLVTCPETKEEECHEEVVITIFVQYSGGGTL